MPKPSKAAILYETDATDADSIFEGNFTQVLRFNSVISEEHTASSVLTKFPVQSGELVSNHAITQNRVVSIKGIVTNTPIDDPDGEFVNYGVNNQKIVFEVVRLLIKNKTPCEVITNLGVYNPVVFNKFKTVQKAGMTDAMEFTISGEEIQIGTAVGGGTPTPLVFSRLGQAESQSRYEDLSEAGYDVSEDSILSEADVDLGKDFTYNTTDELGNVKKITYHVVGVDRSNSVVNHDVSITNVPVVGNTKVPDQGTSQSLGLLKGVSVATACLAEQSAATAAAIADVYVHTALGELKKDTYGFLYDKLGVRGNSGYGQLMLGIALDCFVAGAVGATSNDLTADDFPLDIPKTSDVLNGASSIGNGIVNDNLGIAAPTTLTKISPAGGVGKKYFGDIT